MESSAMQPEDELSWIWKTMKTPKPDESFDMKYWKKIFISSCLCAVLLDPLFLYVPILKDDIKCLMLDPKLKIVVLLLRSLTDFFYLMDIIIQIYRSENYSSSIRLNFNFVLKSCVPRIAKTIWASYDILIDIAALLPLPQVAILIFFSEMSDLRSLTTTRMVLMNVFALLQYVPRVLRIYLPFKELKKRTLNDEIRETPIWIKGLHNFSMYIIASHVAGALWYFFAIQRMMICWHYACRKNDGCDNRMFGCHDHHFFRNTTILNDLCPVSVADNSSDTMFFDFGIFATVLKYGIVGSTSYFKKFLNCFWWGLRNLSSLGSNLEPSADGWENLYTVFISISGLLLFLYLIGNLQMYMQQFETTRREDHKRKMLIQQKMEQKGQDIELWLFKKGVPTRLNTDVKLQMLEKVQQALEDGMDINLDNILRLLPSDVQSLIEDYMPLTKLKQVPMLRGIDEHVLKTIWQKFKPVRYTESENSFIIQKDEPLDKMVYIVDRFVYIKEGSSSRPGAGELCGEELLRWPFSSFFPLRKPLATESVMATGVVEALALKASDLQSIYMQSGILEKEKSRHIRMMKEEFKLNIDGLIQENDIFQRLKDVKSRIMESVELKIHQDGLYWDLLNWDQLVSYLPKDFQDQIERYLPVTKLAKVPMLQGIDEDVLKIICQKLKLVRYIENSFIIQNGEQLDKMVYIVDGFVSIEERSSDDSRRGAGELCGEELLRWPFCLYFPHKKPLATESVKAIGFVEALALNASDLQSIYMQSDILEKEKPRHRRMLKEEIERNIDELIRRNEIPEMLNQDVKSRIMKNVEEIFQQDDLYWDLLDWDHLVDCLTRDLQDEIKSYMPVTRLKKVPMLQGIDEDVWKIICQKLKLVRYIENNFIIQKGEQLDKMVYIVDGFVSIEERSSDDSRRGAGELCGEELLRWPFCLYFPHQKPLATESVKAIGFVKALALNASDLQSIYMQPDILEKEKPRHRRMLKEEIGRNIDGLIPRNEIPERLNQDVKSRIMKNVEEIFQQYDPYWNLLDWDLLFDCLTRDLQDDINSYMPVTKLKKISAFRYMDKSVLKEICNHLRPKKYNRTDNIIEKGDPIQMLLIVEGRIGQEGWVKDAGEIYGEELLAWPFSTSFPDKVPTAAKSPFVITDVVEALVLTHNDMESVATQFRKHFIKNYGKFVRKFNIDPFTFYFLEWPIKKATRNYTCLNYPNEGGYGIVYHTKLYGRAVAIKTCNSAAGVPFIQSQHLVHEAFVLLHINHENVERLLCCCLETRWPVMVYDSTNALTLVEHFHKNKSRLSLESRTKIAAETAGALAHVHSRSVIHRDVKTTNILIDCTTHTVKVTGFGASRLLDEDEGEMEDEVSTLPGTSRHLDPEYLKSRDVYSFGVVLVELLTRQEAISSDGFETSLANDFICSVQEDHLGQILDGEINTDKFSFEMAKKVSVLAVTCLRSRGEERPSMEKVAEELEGLVQTIRNRVEHSTVDDNVSSASRTSE